MALSLFYYTFITDFFSQEGHLAEISHFPTLLLVDLVTDSSPVLSQCVPAGLAPRPASITTPQAPFINA